MADGIKIGNLDISAFKVGSGDCKVYLGDVKVYPSTDLPYDSKVQYLKSDSGQYIDTGIIPSGSTFGMKLRTNYGTGRYDANNDCFIAGCRNDSSNTRWCIGRTKYNFYYGYGGYEKSSESIYATIFTTSLNFLNDKKFTVNGSSMSLPSLSFTPSYNIRLFGSAGVSAYYSVWYGEMYSAQISNGSDIIMDLIPVRKDGVGYMYDKISGNLLGNNGTGSFIIGPDIN